MKNYQNQYKSTLSEIKKNGLFKEERIINSSQQIQIKTKDTEADQFRYIGGLAKLILKKIK